tara:strand:+ start:359 stop:850 length:492 start_codon:yes stop_codon:yes gene_type:complete
MENALILLLLGLISSVIKWFKKKQEEAQKLSQDSSTPRSFEKKSVKSSAVNATIKEVKPDSPLAAVANDPVVSFFPMPLNVQEDLVKVKESLPFEGAEQLSRDFDQRKSPKKESKQKDNVKDRGSQLLIEERPVYSKRKIRDLFLFKELIDGPIALREGHLGH